MSISLQEQLLLDLFQSLNRPQINIFSLNRVLNDRIPDREGYSYLTKSVIFFLYKVFSDRIMFQRFEHYNGIVLPWRLGGEARDWIMPFSDVPNTTESRELCFGWLDLWYQVFFENPFFYIKWTEEDGYGYYSRAYICDIRPVLQEPVFRHKTFLEKVTEFEMEILKLFGFSSFFMYDFDGVTEWYLLIGFWMMANSSRPNNSQPNCPIFFEHMYQFFNHQDPDCEVGGEYRTIAETRLRNFVEVNNIY